MARNSKAETETSVICKSTEKCKNFIYLGLFLKATVIPFHRSDGREFDQHLGAAGMYNIYQGYSFRN